MRRGILIAWAVLAGACHGPHAATTPDRDDDPRAFGDPAGFRPTAFTVDVVGPDGGRPIVFIPGLGCPGDVWRPVLQRLPPGYQAHVLTLAGFAGTAPIKQPLSATVRKELVRYLRSRRLAKPVIVGHSLGGFVAYWLAERHPELVGPVAIVDAGPAVSDTDEDTARQLRAVWAKASEDELARTARGLFVQMVADPKSIAPYLDAIARSDARTMGDAIYELVTTDLRPHLDAITAPVLVVLADGMFQARIRAQVAPLHDAQVVLVPNARHFVFLDAPDRFAAILADFLARHPN